ncbi:hypothetical protein Tco_0857298 [Tanacetum coccineum]|uniref:Uncharacterized protein n=1 Tax=Tanacetum coccineum TaxID=301880 RepID=A0ABQ5B6P7_9ASTR
MRLYICLLIQASARLLVFTRLYNRLSFKPCMSAVFAALQVCSIVNDSLGVTQMLIVIVQVCCIRLHSLTVSSTAARYNDLDDVKSLASIRVSLDSYNAEGRTARKVEAYASYVIPATRAIREPRVVVQTSEVDILDDGYRRRKCANFVHVVPSFCTCGFWNNGFPVLLESTKNVIKS